MIQILQTGTYNSKNKGDAAMQISTADSITQKIPNCKVLISTPFPEIDRHFYSNYELIICNRRRLIWASLQLCRASLWGIIKKLTGQQWNWLIPEKELQEYINSEVIVDLSGDMLTEDYGPHVAYSHYLPLLLAMVLHRPYIICAQSIGPFKLTRPLAIYILNRAAFITTRDQISLDYLLKIGVKASSTTKTADMAFLLKPVASDAASTLLKHEGFIPKEGRKLLGVSLSRLVESKYNKKNPNAKKQDLISLFASVLDEIASQYGMDIIFIAHVTGPADSKDDRQIHKEVQAKMQSTAHVIQGDYTPSELKGIISLCHTMFGARMHANIGALSSNIPTIAIAYSHKTPGIMKMLGQEESVLDITNLDQQKILNKFDYHHNHRKNIISVLEKAIIKVKNQSQVNIDMIDDLTTKTSSNPG